MANIGLPEILVLALIVILLFGGRKIPELFKGMGEAIREFRHAAKDSDSDKEN
jgi:sec-independent protein translocase protein TatA